MKLNLLASILLISFASPLNSNASSLYTSSFYRGEFLDCDKLKSQIQSDIELYRKRRGEAEEYSNTIHYAISTSAGLHNEYDSMLNLAMLYKARYKKNLDIYNRICVENN